MTQFMVAFVTNAQDTNPRQIPLTKIVEVIRTGGTKLKGQITQIRNRFEAELALNGDYKAAKKLVGPLKLQLPGVLYSASKIAYRENKALEEHSGLFCADMDHLSEKEIVSMRQQLSGTPHVVLLFLSPCGDGLKAVFRVMADKSRHRDSYRAIEQYILKLTGKQIDEKCKDEARMNFLSFDPGIYVNLNAVVIEPLPLPEKPPRMERGSEVPADLPLRERIATELLGPLTWSQEKNGYFCKCPGEASHTNSTGFKHTILYLDGVPTLDCQHDSCSGIVAAFNAQLRSLIGKAERQARAERGSGENKANPSVEWPDPQALPEDLPAVPPFDYQCLPETLRPHIMDVAERMQCPPDFPAVGMMIALGSVLGRKIGIKPKRRDDWLEIANLWGCIIARPGLLKTPALHQALVHLRRLAAKAYEKYEKEIRDHAINVMLAAQSKKLAEDKIKKHLKDDQALEARKEAEDHLDKAQEKPVCRRYEINDSSTEKLGELLAENLICLLLVRDEISGFLRDLDREDRAGDRAKYLEMWDGKGEFTYDRIGRGTVRIPSNTLAILGGIQPDVLMAYVREAVRGGIGNDGLLQRLQMSVWPDVPGEWRNVDEWPDTEAKNQAFAVFEYLDNLTPKMADANTEEGEIPFLRFTDDAQECFDAWRTKLEKKLRSDLEHPAFEAHLAKYKKLVPALALLIHLAERKTGRVSLSALSKSLLWADYLEAHARRIYSAVLRPDTAAARELAKHLQRGDLQERFRLREVYRKGWTGLNNKEDAEAAAEILCDHSWIRLAAPAPDRPPGTPGRAASQMFEVNPKILRHPSIPADKTDTIDSGGSVSGGQGVYEKSSTDSVSSVSDHPEETEESRPPIVGDEKGVARL
jgi:hypothetical protein